MSSVLQEWRKRVAEASSTSFKSCSVGVLCYGVPFEEEAPTTLEELEDAARSLGVPRPDHVKIVNAFDGKEYHVGDVYSDPAECDVYSDPPFAELSVPSQWRILDVDDSVLSARALVRRVTTGEMKWVALGVRFTHPRYFFQRVAFLLT